MYSALQKVDLTSLLELEIVVYGYYSDEESYGWQEVTVSSDV